MAATTPKKRAIGLWRPDAPPVAGTLELVPVLEELVAVRLLLEVRSVEVPEADALGHGLVLMCFVITNVQYLTRSLWMRELQTKQFRWSWMMWSR